MLDGKDVRISFITELELLCKPNLKETEKNKIQAFIDDCTILEMILQKGNNCFVKTKTQNKTA